MWPVPQVHWGSPKVSAPNACCVGCLPVCLHAYAVCNTTSGCVAGQGSGRYCMLHWLPGCALYDAKSAMLCQTSLTCGVRHVLTSNQRSHLRRGLSAFRCLAAISACWATMMCASLWMPVVRCDGFAARNVATTCRPAGLFQQIVHRHCHRAVHSRPVHWFRNQRQGPFTCMLGRFPCT